MAITITITDPQDHAPYELRVLGEYFQALANDKRVATTRPVPAAVRTTHDEELLSEEERAALLEKVDSVRVIADGLESAATEPLVDLEELKASLSRGEGLRGTAGGDQEPYAVNAGGSDDFAELRDDPKPDASTGAAASDGKTAQAASTPSLDSAGMPWDERIHSGSKSVNADGTWRYKRGGDLAERDRVEKELLGNVAGSEANSNATASASETADTHGADDDIPPPPTEAEEFPPVPFDESLPLPVEDDVPPPPAEEDDVPPPPAEEEAPQVDSGAVFRAITAGQKANLSQEDIARCLKDVGLTTTVDILTAKPEVLAPLKALIEEASK